MKRTTQQEGPPAPTRQPKALTTLLGGPATQRLRFLSRAKKNERDRRATELLCNGGCKAGGRRGEAGAASSAQTEEDRRRSCEWKRESKKKKKKESEITEGRGATNGWNGVRQAAAVPVSLFSLSPAVSRTFSRREEA